jgi:DNA topoisomerase-1
VVCIGSTDVDHPRDQPVTARGANGVNEDPAAAAEAAGLYYVNDGEAGIDRVATKHGFRLRRHNGKPVADRRLDERVRRLVIPPAWTDVWICSSPRGHIQAMGRDARGRKQYIYHPEWRRVRDRTKFERMVEFGRTLPRIRARVDRDLACRSLGKERVLAAIVSLLDATHIRIGNAEYARSNGSFGLTTLRDRHVTVTPATLTFRFRAKSGKEHRITLGDRRLSRVVRACQDLPGQRLFQYLDGETPRAITSEDVNAYLREISGDDFTAKDFRTWAGTVLAGMALCELGTAGNRTAIRRNLSTAIKGVAARLGNTPAVCRKCYIHPAVIEAYESGTLTAQMQSQPPTARRRLNAEETALLAFLTRLRRHSGAKTKSRRRSAPANHSMGGASAGVQ